LSDRAIYRERFVLRSETPAREIAIGICMSLMMFETSPHEFTGGTK
jgi:hypothetical protein